MFHQPKNSRKNFNYNAYIYSDTVWESHFHSNYELIYVLDGKITITFNTNEETLCEGELILLSPYAVHALEPRGTLKAWTA